MNTTRVKVSFVGGIGSTWKPDFFVKPILRIIIDEDLLNRFKKEDKAELELTNLIDDLISKVAKVQFFKQPGMIFIFELDFFDEEEALLFKMKYN